MIISDLNEAVNKVSTSAYNGRVNQRAVKDLMARVYLTRGYEDFGSTSDFSTAAALANEVIAGQTLTLTFEQLWKPGNEMNSEVVFSVQFSEASQATDPTNLGHRQANFFSSYLGGSEIAGKAPFRTYTLCPTDFAIGLYEQNDSRWAATFMTQTFEVYYDYFNKTDHSGLTVKHYYAPKWATTQDIDDYKQAHPSATVHAYGTYGAQVASSDYQTIPVKKFDDPKSPFGGRANNGRVSTRNIILSRLGETYLIAAEAYLKAGNTQTGLDRLNEVRRRAGVAKPCRV